MQRYQNQTVRLLTMPTGQTSSQYPIKVGQLFTVKSIDGCCLHVGVNAFESYVINHERFEILDPGTKLLEWTKCCIRALGVDITSINPATIFRVPNNVAEVYRADIYVPQPDEQPEVKVAMWLYPQEQRMIINGNQHPTTVEKLFREHGYEGPQCEHWEVDII